MLSSSNQSSQITAAIANDQRQVVKKLTVGVSSILLGLAVAGVSTAHADTVNQPVDGNEQVSNVNSNQTINDNNEQVLKTIPAASAAVAQSTIASTATANSAAISQSNSAVANSAATSSAVATDHVATAASEEPAQSAAATTAADDYETAVNATMKTVTPTVATASAASDNAVNSSATDQPVANADSSAVSEPASAATDENVVPAVPMTNYDVQPYDQAQREANAQAGLKIATDFVNMLTASSLTAKIGQGITFIKDTISLITRHPLAYQRYQLMTAQQVRLAKRQHALAIKQQQMQLQHKAQWKINFIVSQQKFLANWQQRLAVQRQTMVGYLHSSVANNLFALA